MLHEFLASNTEDLGSTFRFTLPPGPSAAAARAA